ncbi:MAG: phage portal protein [Phycisphaerales bacterium]|nr:phage portal protein [Phycisphaerales bacterium]
MAGELTNMPAGGVWLGEDARYGASAAAYPAYLTATEAAALERIRQGRMLFDGRHREYFLGERRTQFSFRQVRTNDGRVRTLYVTTNVLKLVAMKAADLLFGEAPLIGSDDAEMDQTAAAIAQRSGLHQVLYQAAVDAAVEGQAYLEAIVYDGQVYLQQVPGEEMMPLGKLMPDGQYAAYVRRTLSTADGRSGQAQTTLLLETTYRAGSIERACFDVTSGAKQPVGLERWPGFAGGVVPPAKQQTGIAWNTITWVANLMVRRRAVSDFDGLVELQDTLNAKASQLALIFLKHSQPKLLVPEQMATPEGSLADAEVLFKRDTETAEYLTWDAQVEAAMKDRQFVLQLLLVAAETSPVLLGLKDGAAPDAYRKVKLEAFNSLTKAARRAVYWTEGVRTAITAALMLAGTLPGGRYVDSQISVQLRDGIPADQLDEANRLATLKTADIVDDQWCLEQLLADPTEVAAILERKAAKAAAATPSILMGEGTGGSDAESGRQGDMETGGQGEGSQVAETVSGTKPPAPNT